MIRPVNLQRKNQYFQTRHRSTNFRSGTTRTMMSWCFAMLALLQLAFWVLALSEPMVVLALSYLIVIPPSTFSYGVRQQICWELASHKIDIGWFIFFLFSSFFPLVSQEVLHYLQGKIVLELVPGSNEKKEFDVCAVAQDKKNRTMAKGNNAPVSVSKPFN